MVQKTNNYYKFVYINYIGFSSSKNVPTSRSRSERCPAMPSKPNLLNNEQLKTKYYTLLHLPSCLLCACICPYVYVYVLSLVLCLCLCLYLVKTSLY